MVQSRSLGKFENASCVAFSCDGHVVAISEDDKVRVLDVATGAERLQFTEHAGEITCLNGTVEGECFVSGDGVPASKRYRPELSIRMWSAHTGEEIAKIDNREARVLHLDVGKSGRRIVATFNSNCIGAWERTDVIERLGMFMIDGVPVGIRLLDGGNRIACAHSYFDGLKQDYFIKILNPLNGAEAVRLRQPTEATCFAASPCERHFAVGRNDGAIDLWDASRQTLSRTIQGAEIPVEIVGFSKDSDHLVAVHREKVTGPARACISVWTAADGQVVQSTDTEFENAVEMALSVDSSKLAVLHGFPRELTVFDLGHVV